MHEAREYGARGPGAARERNVEGLEQRFNAKVESLEQRMTIKLGYMLGRGDVTALVELLRPSPPSRDPTSLAGSGQLGGLAADGLQDLEDTAGIASELLAVRPFAHLLGDQAMEGVDVGGPEAQEHVEHRPTQEARAGSAAGNSISISFSRRATRAARASSTVVTGDATVRLRFSTVASTVLGVLDGLGVGGGQRLPSLAKRRQPVEHPADLGLGVAEPVRGPDPVHLPAQAFEDLLAEPVAVPG